LGKLRRVKHTKLRPRRKHFKIPWAQFCVEILNCRHKLNTRSAFGSAYLAELCVCLMHERVFECLPGICHRCRPEVGAGFGGGIVDRPVARQILCKYCNPMALLGKLQGRGEAQDSCPGFWSAPGPAVTTNRRQMNTCPITATCFRSIVDFYHPKGCMSELWSRLRLADEIVAPDFSEGRA